MEAAGLYAYAQARNRDVVCVAHVTNTMATAGDDFDKGADDGTERILALVATIASRCGGRPSGSTGARIHAIGRGIAETPRSGTGARLSP